MNETNMTRNEASNEIKSILEKKFIELIKSGMSPESAIKDVMGAFEAKFPGLIDKL